MIYPADTPPCTPVRVHAADGAYLVACAHGGQVLGWAAAGDDRDRLWLSPLARCGPGEAIRGGIPVIFPQFAGRGPLPKHGLARDRAWTLDTGSDGAPVARVAAQLVDDGVTASVWPHRFTLGLVAEAAGDTLTVTLSVRNDAPAGGAPFEFTAALHTYFAVDAPAARLHGLAGTTAEDNAAAGATAQLPDAPLPGLGPADLAVRDAPEAVDLDDGTGRRVRVHREAPFDSLVVWNPGTGHGLADVPPDGASQFLCVEPATLTPVRLEPRRTWRATVRLTALVP